MSADPLHDFAWKPQPQAAQIIAAMAGDVLSRCPDAACLAARMRDETGTRFIDWVDHFTWPQSEPPISELCKAGFAEHRTELGNTCLSHADGIFPRVRLSDTSTRGAAIKVESLADFLFAQQTAFDATIQGQPLAPLRKVRVASGDGAELWAVERHGYRGFDALPFHPEMAMRVLEHYEAFRRRRREFHDERQVFAILDRLLDAAIADLGVDRACDLFFAAEREYWQWRNHAAQVQKRRQDQLGLGWANHDHHTYRSSRRYFRRLIGIFEKLGFHCRERFYAGKQAGWGAQVLEQPTAGIVIFADVDLSPEELAGDFAHEPLPERKQLGTVGLWCALHGEAILEAGMHHLECQFDFNSLQSQLEAEGIKTMKPFTDLPYLRQAFTEGQRWPVREARIRRLMEQALITEDQARAFRQNGAIGSHLENLQRDEGFKGFNQQGVTEIITATDPRKHLTPSATR